MRVFAIAACVAFFLNTGAAFAADCSKGMLWPYVRNPGDCLTDEEIRTGKLGASNGPVNTAPDVSAIRPGNAAASAAPAGGGAQVTTASLPSSGAPGTVAAPDLGNGYLGSDRACTKGWLWPFARDNGDCLTDTEKKNGLTGVYGGGAAPVSQTNNAAPPTVSTAPGGTAVVASVPATGACTKGWLWPFVRDSGDCLTDTEKKEGLAGTYGGGPAPVSQASYAAPSMVSTAPGGTAVVASVPATGACTKGWLWPFVRDSGDCLTDTEKKEGLAGTYGGGPAPVSQASYAAPPAISAVPGSTATVASVPAATGACSKGWLWPFVRDNGDCLTATEKQEGHAGVYGNPDAVPVAPPPAVATASAPAPAATPAVYREGACNKGWFWPFVRSDGDCLTATEKQAGHSGVYGNPSVMPVSQTVAAPAVQAPAAQAPAAQAPAQVPAPMMTMADMNANGGQACHKGIFWPFSRSAGDCLTETEKKEGHTGVYGSGQ